MGVEGDTTTAEAFALIAAVTLSKPNPGSGPAPCAGSGPACVRLLDCRLTQTIEGALPRSATLRALVARIESLEGLVYVTTEIELRDRHNRRLRGKTWNAIVAAGTRRLVRVAIERRYDEDGIALLAHELQHVIELLESPVGYAGQPIGDGIRETREAQLIERTVAEELRSNSR